jgi:hypothetical protein
MYPFVLSASEMDAAISVTEDIENFLRPSSMERQLRNVPVADQATVRGIIKKQLKKKQEIENEIKQKNKMPDFEINHDLDFSQKLNKRDLAIKYLGFINDADEILNRNQSKQALDYLLDLFLHENERTDTLFAMTDANQVLIINTLVDLIKTELKSYLNDVKNFVQNNN